MENFHEEDNLVKEYDWKIMKRLLGFAKPFKHYFVIILILMLIATSIDILRPYLIKNAIDNYINYTSKEFVMVDKPVEDGIKLGNKYFAPAKGLSGDKATIAAYNRDYYMIEGKIEEGKPFSVTIDRLTQGSKIYNAHKLSSDDLKIIRKDDANGVMRTTMLTLAICVSIFILSYIWIYMLQYVGQKIVFDIREGVFKHVEGLSLSFFDRNPVGRLVTRVTNDIETLNEMYTGVLVYIFKDVFLLAGILIAMFMLNVKLALITLFSVPFVIIGAAIFKKYDRDAYREVRARLARINSSLSENISGMKIVQIYNKEEKKFKEFDAINNMYFKASMKQLTIFALFRPMMDLVSSLTLSALLWFGCSSVFHKNLPIGVLFAFVNYLSYFFQPIFDITEKYDILQSSMASAERIFMLMDNNEIIKDAENPIKLRQVTGEIEFRNVWFAYNEEQWVLKDVSFKILPGQKVAFVGATGAGKTSIISLISRLYDIQKGEILIDGINIKDMEQSELRRLMATVLQDVFLFTGDIKGNIKLSNENISDEDVIKACKYVNADRFIERLPKKYDESVNERGTTFSQGERQLIAFARAIAFDPPILVLDEATSNIDTETESLIQNALEKITDNRTTIVVAHRLSTIRNADKIIVLHKGRIREIGSHDELIAKEGLYFNLYKLQYREEETFA